MERSQLLNDPEQSLRIALDGHQAGLWTALPAIVVSVNWTLLTIEAQPAVQGVTVDDAGNETYVNLPVLGDVPLMFPAAGGFALTFPVAVGDEVLIVIASRAIDSWWQNGAYSVSQTPTIQPQPPVEVRMHDLSDGFAIPAQMSNPKTKNYAPHVSQTACRLTKQDGSAYIEFTSAGVCNIVAPGGVNITGALNVTGNTQVTGTLGATGEIAAHTGGTPIHLTTHTHSGVTTGSGTSGAPTPGS